MNKIIEYSIKSFLPGLKEFPSLTADDLRQEAELTIIRCQKEFKPELGTKFENFAITCIRHAIGLMIKKEKKFKGTKDYYRETEKIYDFTSHEEVYNPEYKSYLKNKLHEAINELENKDIIIDYYFNKLTLREIAAKHNCTAQNISLIVIKARKILAEKLKNENALNN